MELSRREVPLYGQVEVCGKLQGSLCIQEETDYYVVLMGSSLHHVAPAHRSDDHSLLRFTVPGHDVPEKVSVMFYSCTRDSSSLPISPLSHSEELSLEYKRDEVQEMAEQLMTSDPLTSCSLENILRKFCPEKEISSEQNHLDRIGQHGTGRICDPEEFIQSKRPEETKQELSDGDLEYYSLREGSRTSEFDPDHKCTVGQHNAVDKKITQALANLYFLEWDGQTRRENRDLPTPLHTAIRLGFPHLSHFLLQESESQRMVPTLNEEGPSPLMLAEKQEDPTIASALTNLSRPVWMCQVWTDGSHQLRFCPVTDSVSLSVKRSTQIDAQGSIQLYREKSREPDTLARVGRLRGSSEGSTHTSDVHDRDPTSPLRLEDHTLVDSVFEEQLVLCLDEEEEDLNTFNSGTHPSLL